MKNNLGSSTFMSVHEEKQGGAGRSTWLRVWQRLRNYEVCVCMYMEQSMMNENENIL